MKCKYCEIELSDIDIRFGDSPEGLYMKGYCTDCYNRKDWIEENTIAIKSRDYWFKVLGMLSQNWALIDEQEGGKFKVLFIMTIPIFLMNLNLIQKIRLSKG